MGLKQEQKKLEQNYEQEIIDILVLLGDMGGGAGGVTKGIWEHCQTLMSKPVNCS